MRCAKCGSELRDHDKFCKVCGTPVAASATWTQHDTGDTFVRPDQDAARFTPPVPPQKKKSKAKKVVKGIVIAIVAIFVFLLIIGLIFSDETSISDELKERVIAAIEDSDPDTDFDDEDGVTINKLQSIKVVDDENSPIDILEIRIENSMNEAFTNDDIRYTTLLYIGVNVDDN
jgi:hypothetical protein